MQQYITKNISVADLPEMAKQLHQPIKILHGKGDLSLLNAGKRVGIVGARKFTPYGREVTNQLSTALARAGVTIVSGLALGVDSIAHKACVDAGGKTIAVLPSGIDKIYPSSHKNLADQIVQKGGLLISEYPADHIPMRHDFIERNRIIAGLSDILIVTEAALSSGSLHTASFALELGVTVMAVPGNITSQYSAGTNQLIQNGAFPILNAQNVLEHLGISGPKKIEYIPENEIEQKILYILGEKQTTTQYIAEESGLRPDQLAVQLTLLEIKDVILAENGYWKIK